MGRNSTVRAFAGRRSLLISLVAFACVPAFANSSGGGGSTSVIGLAYSYHVGPKNNSLAGATSYAGFLSSETSGGALRFSLGFGLSYAAGLLTTGNIQYDVTCTL